MPENGVSFENDIKSLFTERDQRAMRSYFDLWAYDDVRRHAAAILTDVDSGRMPCYTFWSKDKVALFRSWMDQGMPE